MKKIHISDESNDRRYFTIIPNYILNHSTIWDRELYIQMKRIAGENGTCYASRTTLSKQSGISPRRIDQSLKYLMEHGWIKFVGTKEVMTKGGIQSVKEYRIADLWKMNVDFYENDKGVAHETTPAHKGVAPYAQRGSTDEGKGVAYGAHKEEPREEEQEKKNQFDDFWKSYPNKKGKENTKKVWNKLSPSQELFDRIIAALAVQKKSDQWTKDGGRFIPHPATWLNGKRWEDEMEVSGAESKYANIKQTTIKI